MSTRGDYASRALLSLALGAELSVPTSVRDLAERTGLPQPYLEQILLILKGVGLVRSKRGVGGGYVLARDAENITLAEIVAAVDGPIVAGDLENPIAMVRAITKDSVCFLGCGPMSATTCVSISPVSPWPTWFSRPAVSSPNVAPTRPSTDIF